MSDIFISYKSEDQAVAEKLAQALERQGWSVFWDRDIPPGQTFDSYISQRLDQARCIIVLWSSRSVLSDWVKEEAQVGAHRKILLPALIENIQPPLGFGRIEAAKLWDWDGQAPHEEFNSLLKAIGKFLESSQSTTTPQSQRASPETSFRPEAVPTTPLSAHLKGNVNTIVMVSLIALVAILGSVALSNWDKLFPPTGSTPTLNPTSASEKKKTTSQRTRSAGFANFKVISQNDQELTIEIDYINTKDPSQRIGLGAKPLRSGKELKYFGYRPTMIQDQKGTARVVITYLSERGPSSMLTDQIKVFMYLPKSKPFHEQLFSLRKKWVKKISAPKQISPKNNTTFHHYPRKTKLVWETVSSASSYSVEIKFLSPGKDCSLHDGSSRVVRDLKKPQHTFNFVGAQPGCWRVWAINSKTEPGPKSRWWKFNYTR